MWAWLKSRIELWWSREWSLLLLLAIITAFVIIAVTLLVVLSPN